MSPQKIGPNEPMRRRGIGEGTAYPIQIPVLPGMTPGGKEELGDQNFLEFFFLFVQKVFEQRLVKIVFLPIPAFHRAGGKTGNVIRHSFLEFLPDLFAYPVNVKYRRAMINQGKEWFFQFVPIDRLETNIFQGDGQSSVTGLVKAIEDAKASSISFAFPLL